MENTVVLIVLISQKSSKLSGISVDHSEIKRTEVFVEWEISQIVVNVEKECILKVLWWLFIRNPIQLIYRQIKN